MGDEGQPLIGAGWAFPLRTGPAGSIALVRGDQELAESIRLVLGTAYGERPMRPEFGCGIHDLLFAPADTDLAGRIRFEVEASLRRWEPRIELVDVDVEVDPSDAATAYITIHYVVVDTNDPRNLVFPFYLLPPEG